ncbi:carbon-monoxide dehydrogenase medium subunit [Amycolatopsis bartoniae]|uniref:Carbon-monoxide dehydrogenase medium subunit n=1 Tax=Amycolatopsis bartoniae TaxID=941986 RepID=A0A8H9IR24_9PSEU|nr:xanthine dehydrogenase family protein subunit M [Amycolatopsis bartoniae]MBB2939579.1 carbon-monoxide dehydrogenase medium subunit [Amycolatopsis bartoniae]TVT07790.1 xanthine dehydrogenase family protein subunit M [Amycolatopsis bartoniae]GHF39352.1 carbon-monoxide dehydrogenase medium subunit [Amycolatopsis bartoniae]
MIPASFTYRRVSTVDEALAVLAEHGEDAKVLAGGHSLLPLMKLRFATPELLVDVAPLDELRYVRVEDGTVAIGALSRYHDLHSDEVLREHAPLLAHVAGAIGDPQVRHRGTIGGSLAHADAAADLPAALLASDGVLVVRGPRGEREIPAGEFFLGPFTTPLEPDELVTEVRVPAQTGLGWAFEKFTRRSIDWAIVGVAVVGGKVGLVNMAGTPIRATATEEALASGAPIAEAAALAAEGASPVSEPHASAEYREHLARVLTKRALTTAAA